MSVRPDLSSLLTPEQADAEHRREHGIGFPKAGLPTVLARKERKKKKADKAEAFRLAVWKRDRDRSRATGRPLVKSGTDDWSKLGEVDHAINRSTAPDRVYDISNGILLSKEENRLKKVACRRAPEHRRFEIIGPDDRAKTQRFEWRNDDGVVVKVRHG